MRIPGGLVIGVLVLAWKIAWAADDTAFFTVKRFGEVHVVPPDAAPQQVVLFALGAGGWDQTAVERAHALAELGVLTVGFESGRYLKQLARGSETCAYVAADLETLSHSIQKKLDLPRYLPPVLAGGGDGAALVYAALAQAPPNTFTGAVSFGFCPSFALAKALCKGNGLLARADSRSQSLQLLPAKQLTMPWTVLQPVTGLRCDAAKVNEFVAATPLAELITLHDADWRTPLQHALQRSAAGAASATFKAGPVQDLPLVELPAQGSGSDLLAVIFSGDGGWASIDRQIGEYFAQQGIATLGWNSLQYFWKPRTAETSATDLSRAIDYYLQAWGKHRVLLVGYSLGADVLPAIANHLPGPLRQRITEIALLGPAKTADFEFHLSDWFGGGAATSTSHPVRPELEKLRGENIVCFYGAAETDSLCRDLPTDLAKVIELSGSHHFGGDYQSIAKRILNHLEQ